LTKVFFYHDAASRLASAVSLLGRTFRQGKAILVYAPDARLAETLDRQLWITPPTGFIPHVRGTSPLASETPIVITADVAASTQSERLLNFSAEVPPAFSRFASLIEVVGLDDDERREARERVRFYKDRGYAIQFFDLSKGAS
jgi:DNA polymerase-3 subunit chi